MFKLTKFVVLFTLMALLVVSPVFAQSSPNEVDVVLMGVIARGDQFASVLRVYTPSSTFYDVIWSEDGRVLYQTPAFEQVLGIDDSGDMLVVQRDGTLFLGSITADSYHELHQFSQSHAYFDVLFTNEGTFYVLAIVNVGDMEWGHTLYHYSMSGELLGEWEIPMDYMFIEAYSLVGRYVVLQEMPEGGPRVGINLDDGSTFQVDHDFDDPQDLRLERMFTIEGSTTTMRLCQISVNTGECIPETIIESIEPTQYTDSAYIYRPIQIPGTNMLAGFGWASGLSETTFLVIDNGPEWEVVGWFDDPPARWLYFDSELQSFAVNQQGEAALVWGTWASGYSIRRAFLNEALEGQIPVEDITDLLYPTYEEILEALPQQG